MITFLITLIKSYSNDTILMTSSYPTNEFCNFTFIKNNTYTYNGKTRYQTYQPNKHDNNCTICLHLGCTWCSRLNNVPGYCYNGDNLNYCNDENDARINSYDTCNNDVAIIVIFFTIFFGIILPFCLICGFFSCVLYFAHRYWKSRQREQRIVAVECEIPTIELQQPHQQYHYVNTIVIDNNRSIHYENEEKSNNDNNKIVYAVPI